MKDPVFPFNQVVLALGSNIGDRLDVMRRAIDKISSYVTIEARSPVYETNPLYVTDQPTFLNAVILGETRIEPLSLLWSIRQLENELGRKPTFRYGPRAIDIDIIFYGDKVIRSPELSIPHPRMEEREFVLRPLADIAPQLKHPITGLTILDMLNGIPSNKPLCLGDTLSHAA